MGIGGFILVIVLIIGGMFLGYTYGIAYTLRKIKERCGDSIYTVVMVGLKENKED